VELFWPLVVLVVVYSWSEPLIQRHSFLGWWHADIMALSPLYIQPPPQAPLLATSL
jgi:hypothetical protein